MSDTAPSWFVEQYRDRVTHVYQSKGYLLKGMVMPEGTLEGTRAYWPVMATGTARKKVRGNTAVPMNAGKSRVSADLETFEAFDEVHTYDLSRLGPNEKQAIQESGAMALGRSVDGEIITKMNASAATSGANYIANTSTAFGLVEAMSMVQALQAKEVPMDGNIWCGLHSKLWNHLMSWKQFSSADYVGADLPFKASRPGKTWNNVNWFLIPDTYLPVPTTNQIDVFMWHKSALGWANNADLKTMMQWDNRAGCWTIRMEAEGAAVCIQPDGIVRGRFLTNQAITAN
jgi:hypothetical protein